MLGIFQVQLNPQQHAPQTKKSEKFPPLSIIPFLHTTPNLTLQESYTSTLKKPKYLYKHETHPRTANSSER